MNTFIQNLLILNTGIVIVIVAFILLRHLLKSKVHTKILCILWIVIFLRMLIPIPIESNIGLVETGFVMDSYIAAENYVYTYTNDAAENKSTNDGVNINTAENAQPVENINPVNNTAGKISIAALVYVCGAAAALMYISVSNVLFNRRIRKQGIEIELSDAESQVFVDQNIKRIKVILVEDLQSPCLVGVIRRKILLNRKSTSNERTKRYSLYHETTHYKNKDNFIFLLGLISCIINWFNPLMWIALSLSKKDREVQCDEQVVKKIGEQEMVEYVKSLLFVAQKSGSKLLTVPTTMTGGKKEMKQRIKNLASNKKRWIAISILVAAIIISLIAVVSITKSNDRLVGIEPSVYSELHEIYNEDEYSEYTALFDEARYSSNITILTIYRADLDKDGTDELYTNSYVRNDRFPPYIIECYDLKTDTYSNISSIDAWDYFLMNFDDKLYIFEISKKNVANDTRFHVYEPYLSDGKLLYKEIDSDLERNIIDFWVFSTFVNANEEEGNDVEIRAQNTLDISIYDISSEEVFITSYTQEVTQVMDKVMLLFSNINGSEGEDIDHPYMSVISLKYAAQEMTTTIYFGDSEYITTIEDGVKVNWENDGLRNFLNALADDTYTETNN